MATDDITVESFFALMLLAMQDRIKDKVPEIKYMDQDLGQLEEDTDRPRVAWPCLLVDFPLCNYDEMQGLTQWANLTIQLRLGFNPFSSANAATPLPYRQDALKYYELEMKVYKALQAWDADGLCQPLTRVSGNTERGRDDLFRVRTMNFTTTFMDASAVPVKSEVSRPEMIFT